MQAGVLGVILDLFCGDLDREIVCFVYKLYELTDDEIGIVEGSTKR